MTDQPISSMVLCWPCQTPKPLSELARGPDGIPQPLCHACAAKQPAIPTARDPIGDCEPQWTPTTPATPRTINLQDIANYQEPQ